MDYLTQSNTVVVVVVAADLELGQVNESFFSGLFVCLLVCFKVRAVF